MGRVSALLAMAICSTIIGGMAFGITVRSRIWKIPDEYGIGIFEGYVLIPVSGISNWRMKICFDKIVKKLQVYGATILKRSENGSTFAVGIDIGDELWRSKDDIHIRIQGVVDGNVPTMSVTFEDIAPSNISERKKPLAKTDKQMRRIIKRSAIKRFDELQDVTDTEPTSSIIDEPTPPSREKRLRDKGLEDILDLVPAPNTMITWFSRWGVGGQGQIDLEKTSHGLFGRSWIFRLRFPNGCYLSTAKFWHACIVDSLTEPENGIFTFRQVGWQIYQDFIGILVTFQGFTGSVNCYKSENYNILYENGISAGFNMFPNTCTEEFRDIKLPSSSIIGTVRPQETLKPTIERTAAVERVTTTKSTTTRARLQTTTSVSARPTANERASTASTQPATKQTNSQPTRSNTERTTKEPLTRATSPTTANAVTPTTSTVALRQLFVITPRVEGNEEQVARLRASVVPPSSVQLSWRRVTAKQRTISITYTMNEESDSGSELDPEIAILESSTPPNPAWPPITRQVSARLTTFLIKDLQQGRTYNFTTRTYDGNAFGPVTSVPATLAPSEIVEIIATNPNSTALRFHWVTPPGYLRNIVVRYSPKTANAFPKSPFALAGTTTKATISGLDKKANYSVSFAVYNHDFKSAARNITVKTANRPCGRRGCRRFSRCVQTNFESQCLCNFGYRETRQGSAQRKVCRDINECSGKNMCDENASCRNSQGSYQCQCKTGYEGDGIHCFDSNECQSDETDLCPGAICKNTVGSYTCECEEGYRYDGKSCQDIDECASGFIECPENAKCANTEGSYVCECPAGMRFIENDCQDIDECIEDLHNCEASQTCENNRGSFTCRCPEGKRKTSENLCVDIDECEDNLDNCNKFATCRNIDPSFTCFCNPGYAGNGVLCKDINECRQRHDCDRVGGRCTNTIGSYRCSCKSGFRGDGKECISLS